MWLHKKPKTLYGDHHLAVRDAMQLNDGDDEWLYVATHAKSGRASYIEVFEADAEGNHTVHLGYW